MSKKITQLTAAPAVQTDFLFETVSDPSGTPVSHKISLGNILKIGKLFDPAGQIRVNVSTADIAIRDGAGVSRLAVASDVGAMIDDTGVSRFLYGAGATQILAASGNVLFSHDSVGNGLEISDMAAVRARFDSVETSLFNSTGTAVFSSTAGTVTATDGANARFYADAGVTNLLDQNGIVRFSASATNTTISGPTAAAFDADNDLTLVNDSNGVSRLIISTSGLSLSLSDANSIIRFLASANQTLLNDETGVNRLFLDSTITALYDAAGTAVFSAVPLGVSLSDGVTTRFAANAIGTTLSTDNDIKLNAGAGGAGNVYYSANGVNDYKLPIIQSGKVAGLVASFSEVVTFAKPMPSANYSVSLIGNTSLISPLISGQSTSGFTMQHGSFTGTLFWNVIEHTQ